MFLYVLPLMYARRGGGVGVGGAYIPHNEKNI